MGDEGLVGGEFQPEFALNEGGNGLFDGLGFVPWTSEPQQKIVSVANVAEASVERVVGVECWELLTLRPQPTGFPSLAVLV